MRIATDELGVPGKDGLFVSDVGEIIDELPASEDQKKLHRNSRFTQLYPQGIQALRELSGDSTPLKVFLFIVEHAGHDNALACTVDVIAESEGVKKSPRTVKRAIATLKESGHIRVFKVGTGNVYVLNEAEFWKTATDYKRFCAFSKTKVLISKKENKALKQRLTHFVQPKLL